MLASKGPRATLLPRIDRFGSWAPLISTALFSLYHFWSPWQVLVRLVGFLQYDARATWPTRQPRVLETGLAVTAWRRLTPGADRYGYDESYLRGRIIGALGGIAAEQEVFGVATTGAESDLENATRIARSMVGRWGMSDRIGPMSVLPSDGDARMSGVSDQLLGAVDEEVRKLIDACYVEARRMLSDNRERLERIAEELLERETLDEPEVYAAAGISPAPETPEEIRVAIPAEQRP